ncbi:MAG: NAD(+) diphosphatase [Fretibacterium sp.]|nr:NAD(+) diphosphatase [Fretibacterium sp.]
MFVFQGDKVLVRQGALEHTGRPDKVSRCSLKLPEVWQDLPPWCEVEEDFQPGEGGEFIGLRQVWHRFGDEAFLRAGGAWQYANWWRNVRLCSFCGEPLRPSETDHGRRCPRCGRAFYAPLSPAVIVAIEREVGGERKLLLAHNTAMPEGRLSVLAGFVEPGETLEQAVVREVREEVAIEVRDIRYFKSQPWPFPCSLMLGFTARWKAGELRPDGVEIGEAGWFAPGDIHPANIPDGASIARRLIDHFTASARNPGT